jgi:lipoprotein signal peptidase
MSEHIWMLLLLMSMVVVVNLGIAARRPERAEIFYAAAGLMLFGALMVAANR